MSAGIYSVNHELMLTDAAFAELKSGVVSLPSIPGGAPTPAVGDFLRLPGHRPFSFKVVDRELEYVDATCMKVTVVLDLVRSDSAMPHLVRVK